MSQTKFRSDLVDPSVYLAAGARIVGDVSIGPESSVWFNAAIRGDCEAIRIGARTNVQDNCVLHADEGFPCILGDDVTIGHGAIVHGAEIGDGVLIGMKAVIMNGAKIGAGSIVAVGAVVTEGVVIPPRSLVKGLPGKVTRELHERELERNRHAAEHYVQLAREYRANVT
ncbi:MAG: gamma carbonic anhydrase family protein [Planctomycetaceae bacterium]|nr:gamma carbonic anhydrase family protein [Planctomycetaceae bacterium]